MAKTSKQVQGDIYRLLRDSVLYTQITGEVYREGLRPRDSRKEDAVVIFTTGVPDEIETGVVTVNIYCLLYTSPSPRDRSVSRMPSSA